MKYVGPGMYGMDAPLWVSGAPVAKYQTVTSPADAEEYKRITATGSGTTDPADDVTNYRATSYERTVSLFDPQVYNTGSPSGANSFVGATTTSPGAISVGSRTSVLSVTGTGSVEYLGYFKNASGTMRLEVICDGRTVMYSTVTYTSSSYAALMIGLNGLLNTNPVSLFAPSPRPLIFKRSLQVYVTPVTTAGGASAVFAYGMRGLG